MGPKTPLTRTPSNLQPLLVRDEIQRVSIFCLNSTKFWYFLQLRSNWGVTYCLLRFRRGSVLTTARFYLLFFFIFLCTVDKFDNNVLWGLYEGLKMLLTEVKFETWINSRISETSLDFCPHPISSSWPQFWSLVLYWCVMWFVSMITWSFYILASAILFWIALGYQFRSLLWVIQALTLYPPPLLLFCSFSTCWDCCWGTECLLVWGAWLWCCRNMNWLVTRYE